MVPLHFSSAGNLQTPNVQPTSSSQGERRAHVRGRAADREKGQRISEAGAPLLGSGREVTQTDLCRAHEDRYEAMAAVRGGGGGCYFPSWGDSQLSPKKYR